jgi:hypothetical protein
LEANVEVREEEDSYCGAALLLDHHRLVFVSASFTHHLPIQLHPCALHVSFDPPVLKSEQLLYGSEPSGTSTVQASSVEGSRAEILQRSVL